MSRELVFLDTETTGLIPGYHEIIEVCMVKHDLETVSTIECPERKSQVYNMFLPMHIDRIDPKAVEYNGFDMNEWIARGAIKLSEGINEIIDYMEDCIVVGFNPWFDLRFIEAYCRDHNLANLMTFTNEESFSCLSMHYHVIDINSMAYPLKAKGLINGVKAKDICQFFDIDYRNAHRACNDVELSIECFRCLLDITDYKDLG
jgi:DNA polymerase III epsilon subunit-like protein